MIVICLVLPFLYSQTVERVPGSGPMCLSRRMAGMECPMCGLSRGLLAVLHGDFYTATVLNILSVPVFLLLVIELIYRSVASVQLLPGSCVNRVARTDFLFHVILATAYLCYAAAFFIC